MYRLTRFYSAFLILFAGAFFLTACETEPEPLEGTDPDITAEDDLTGTTDPGMTDPGMTDTGLFGQYDTNQDTYLDENEYGTVGNDGLFGQYDTNQDTYLDENEYGTGYVGSGFDTAENFSTYDTDGDGRISQDEFRTGLFNRMDADGDGRISQDEFRRYESMMGGMGAGTGAGTTPTDGM